MSSVGVETRDGVAVVTLDRKVTNAISLELITELGRAVRAVGEDPDARGMVLTGAGGKFFSIGFDIPRLFPCSREEFGEFYRTVNRVSLELYALGKALPAGHSETWEAAERRTHADKQRLAGRVAELCKAGRKDEAVALLDTWTESTAGAQRTIVKGLAPR